MILGSDDWAEGVMHHKMLLCDDVVWTGSYNFTWQARRNYETLLRFADRTLAEDFWAALDALMAEEELWEFRPRQGSQCPGPGGRFRCCACFKLMPAEEEWDQQNGSNSVCQACGDAELAARRRLGLVGRAPQR